MEQEKEKMKSSEKVEKATVKSNSENHKSGEKNITTKKEKWRKQKDEGVHLLAIQLGDGLLGQGLGGVGHKGTPPALAIVVAQDVQLHNLPDRPKQALQVLLSGLVAHPQ